MNLRRFMVSLGTLAALATTTTGCFATRMVRSDTSYDVVMAEPVPPPNVAPPAIAVAPIVALAPEPEGTLVVEALVPPPPPAGAVVLPVRLPSSVADQSTRTSTRVGSWDPLPSYVAQYAGPGWQHRPMYGGGTQSSSRFRGWGRGSTVGGAPFTTPGPVGSASPHFSSPPSYGGGLSSHFAGGYPGRR
jgi:hypothetical protein